MKEIIYLCLGGSEESMRLRVNALKKEREKNKNNGCNNTVILDGFSSEILFMKELFTREFVSYAYAFDTLSNIQRCLNDLREADTIYTATSPLHWERIKLIVSKKFPELQGKIKFIPSNERETKYAKLGLWVYKALGPTFLQKVARITRRKKYHREYIAPLRERALCALFGVYY